ncbi:unnamed protein product [Medioppia subpectinata]|uniref:Cytochrome P450 n=1 Tax=Medioppia subpectinata TaxID=1979941 RepID=A0A7R9L2U7_9ACAR|nr:unnamed protein product [Medioppia subpectinata]CAG2114259.1 unnamed protein product [Medioppia subpectinata]
MEVFQKPLSEIEEQRFKEFGKIHGFYDFNIPVLTVGEPELIKQILVKDFQAFVNRRDLNMKSKFFNSWLLFVRDDHWRRLRATISPTFSSAKLKKMFPMIDDCVEAVVKKLGEYSQSGSDVDLKWLYGSYTMNVIAKCAFATDTNALEDRNNAFVKWAYKVVNVPLWRLVVHSVMPAFLRDLTGFTIATPESFQFFKDVAKHVLKERKANPNPNASNDFLQLLVDAERNDDSILDETNESVDEVMANRNALKVNSNASKKLNEDEVIANIVLFLVAGYETTASLLSFATYNLSLNPDSQQLLYEELKSCPELNYESVSKLPFLDAVICETLRLNNPVTRVEREAHEDYVLGDTGLTVKKGSIVAIPIHAIHHDSEYYPNPHQFKPQRFYGDNANSITPYTYLPFGGGPRNCIGMRFALVEAKLALANILMNFEFSKCAKTEIPLRYMNTRPGLLQAISVWANVRRRTHA